MMGKGGQVLGVEKIKDLADQSRRSLEGVAPQLGLGQIRVIHGNVLSGSIGSI